VARRSPAQRQLKLQLDELEQKMHQLKVLYNKYFMGFDAVEPVRERDEIKRRVRDIIQKRVTNNTLRFKFQQLRARSVSLDTWITRNMVQIERGTHPKMKFRADAKQRSAGTDPNAAAADRLEAQRQVRARENEREGTMRELFKDYVSARKKCGQDADMDYRQVRAALRNQARTIQTKESCKDVKFKVKVKGGKASITAIPIR